MSGSAEFTRTWTHGERWTCRFVASKRVRCRDGASASSPWPCRSIAAPGCGSRPARRRLDFRTVPMKSRAAGQSNMETVTHEATHQLTFNTGLLDRRSDIPLCSVEGLAMFSERRKLRGPSEPGQLNLRRLEELAHL